MECAPAFNYARHAHITSIVPDDSIPFGPSHSKAVFESANLSLDLRYVCESASETQPLPEITLETLDLSDKGHLGPAVHAFLSLQEGQAVTFILRIPPTEYLHGPLRTSSDSGGSTPDVTSNVGLGSSTPAEVQQAELDAKARAVAASSKEVRRGQAEVAADRDVHMISALPRGRALDDPFLTKELVHSLLHVSDVFRECTKLMNE